MSTPSRSATGAGGVPRVALDDLGVVEVTGARRTAAANLTRTRRSRGAGCARSMSPKVSGVPEGGGAAVAEHDLVAVGQARAARPARCAARPPVNFTGRLAVAGAEVARCRGHGPRVDRLGPDLGRSGAEPAVGGQQVGGDADLRLGWRSSRATIAGESSIERILQMPPTSRRSQIRAQRPHLRRIAAIAESATLAVDAKAKALKAAGEPVIGFGAGEPDFPTPAAHRRGGGRGLPVTRATTTTRRPPGLPELREAIAAKTARDSRVRRRARAQVLVTNGGKHAVYNTFATLLDPGDEVLLPAPYWTTYPEPIALAGGTPVGAAHRRAARASGSRRPARAADAPTAPRRCCSCRRPTPPARSTAATRSRPSASGPLEHGIWVITDEIYEHLTYGEPHVPLDAGARARARRTLRGAQRRGQDLRHDRLAGRLDDRPARRHQGGDQPPVAHDVERRQRLPAGRAGRGVRATSTPWPRCGRPSTAAASTMLQAAQRHPRRQLHRARGRLLRLPQLRARVLGRRSPGDGRPRPSSWPS